MRRGVKFTVAVSTPDRCFDGVHLILPLRPNDSLVYFSQGGAMQSSRVRFWRSHLPKFVIRAARSCTNFGKQGTLANLKL
jgi:hypothetical protein